MNYASLLATNPDLYPLTMPQNPNLDGIPLTAFRLTHLLENHGYVNAFMAELNQQIKGMDEDAFQEIYKYIFTSMRRQYKTELTIFDVHAPGYLDILSAIINESDQMKELFVHNRGDGMVWIPGPGGINLEKGIGSCTGDLLES